jgi:Holliday junction resolvase
MTDVKVVRQVIRRAIGRREAAIERDCLKWLNTEGGFYAFKKPSIGMFDRSAGAYRKPGPYAVNGVSDIIAIRDGRVLFIEVKTETGKQSADQVKFARAVRVKGCDYIVVRSVEELTEYVSLWSK